MKINLNALRYFYKVIDKEDLQEHNINNFQDFQDFVVEYIIDNLEYDFNINFEDYVDMNSFKYE